MTEPYRYRCPRGHVNLLSRAQSPLGSGDGCYCRTCKQSYDFIIDKKHNRLIR